MGLVVDGLGPLIFSALPPGRVEWLVLERFVFGLLMVVLRLTSEVKTLVGRQRRVPPTMLNTER